jgi:hypothetical protein
VGGGAQLGNFFRRETFGELTRLLILLVFACRVPRYLFLLSGRNLSVEVLEESVSTMSLHLFNQTMAGGW